MRSVVTGLMMLAGSVVREQGQNLDEAAWRREARSGAPVAAEIEEADVTVVAGPPIGGATIGVVEGDQQDGANDAMSMTGDWDVACAREHGRNLMFDRQSVRKLDGVTLFHWATADGRPGADDTVYTAVADCRAKSIEANWPGTRRQTVKGTCGRLLVEAVCDVQQPKRQSQSAHTR